MINRRLLICAIASVIAHLAIARGLSQLPRHEERALPQRIEVRLEQPPPPEPPPEPPPPEPPAPPPPKPVPHELPKSAPVHAPAVAPIAKDAPPPEHPAFQQNSDDEPVYGVQMSSSSTLTGPIVPQGNTTRTVPTAGSAAPVKPLAAPISAAEATKLPLPQGRCFGKYTDEARAAGVEGTVILDLIVGEDGQARDISVSQSLPHGLTEAAIAALRDCRFTPGERDGKPVPVRVRGFKIHFVLDSAN